MALSSSAPLPQHTHHLLLEQSASDTPAEHIRTCQVAQSLNGKCPRASDREISEHIRHRRAETTAETNKSVYQHTGRRENCANKQHTPTDAETTAKQTALQGRDNCRTNNVMIAEKTAEQTLPRAQRKLRNKRHTSCQHRSSNIRHAHMLLAQQFEPCRPKTSILLASQLKHTAHTCCWQSNPNHAESNANKIEQQAEQTALILVE